MDSTPWLALAIAAEFLFQVSSRSVPLGSTISVKRAACDSTAWADASASGSRIDEQRNQYGHGSGYAASTNMSFPLPCDSAGA